MWAYLAGYLLAEEWAVLLFSLALAAVRIFMVTELQWLTLLDSLYYAKCGLWFLEL